MIGRRIRTPVAGHGKPCRHCRERTVTRARRLCTVCHNDLAVRALYPTDPAKGHPGLFAAGAPKKPPKAPTSAAPGTTAKLLVMRARLTRGESLYHADDKPDLAGVDPALVLANLPAADLAARRRRGSV